MPGRAIVDFAEGRQQRCSPSSGRVKAPQREREPFVSENVQHPSKSLGLRKQRVPQLKKSLREDMKCAQKKQGTLDMVSHRQRNSSTVGKEKLEASEKEDLQVIPTSDCGKALALSTSNTKRRHAVFLSEVPGGKSKHVVTGRTGRRKLSSPGGANKVTSKDLSLVVSHVLKKKMPSQQDAVNKPKYL